MLFYLEQPAFTKSRTPAGGTSAALSLRSNVVGTYGSPTNAPSLYTRRSTENCPPPGEGSFYLLKLGSRVSDCYSASLLIGTPRGCFFYLEQPAFTKSRTPAGGTSAALSLRSNVVGTYGSPTNAPSLKCPLRGDQFPGDPRWLSGQAGTFFPLTAPPAGHKFVLNPCRKAHRSYSLFSIHYSLSTRPARRHTAPRHSPPHFPGTPENCSPQGQGASLFHGDMIK